MEQEELLDVMQNIEFAIVSVYGRDSDLLDSHVMRALDNVINIYRAESRGHTPKEHKLAGKEADVAGSVQVICEARIGRAEVINEKGKKIKLGTNNTVDEILTCLRKIRKSVDKWNKRHGQQGYLEFVSQFIK